MGRSCAPTDMAIDPERPFKPINIAVLTVSDTRTAADDTSGDILCERIKAAGPAATTPVGAGGAADEARRAGQASDAASA